MLKWECKTVSRSAPPENRGATKYGCPFYCFLFLKFGIRPIDFWIPASDLRLLLSFHISRSIIIPGRKNRASSRKNIAFTKNVFRHFPSLRIIQAVETLYKIRLIFNSSQDWPDLLCRRFRLKSWITFWCRSFKVCFCFLKNALQIPFDFPDLNGQILVWVAIFWNRVTDLPAGNLEINTNGNGFFILFPLVVNLYNFLDILHNTSHDT